MARNWVALVVLAGCGFSLQLGGDDQVPDGRQVLIIDDAHDDFVGARSDTTITDRGAIELDAFVVNGLHARAFSSTFNAGATYTEAAATIGTRLGEGYHQVPFRFDGDGADHPHGVGISSGPFTLLYDGEIFLPAGVVDFEVDADDRCAVEIMLDGSTWTDSMIDAYDAPNPHRTLAVTADGWYPIRAAFVQTYGGSYFDMFYTPAGGTRIHVDHNQTRVRVTDAQGLIVQAFRYRVMLNALGSSAVATVDADFGSNAPAFDLAIPTNEFALRYLGQLRIDEAGDYRFTADASTSGNNGGDFWRIWIDGAAITGTSAATPSTTATIHLDPGWHDFGVDFSDDSDDARIRARMAGPNIADGPIDPTRLRPAVATGLTAAFGDLSTRFNIVDASSNGPTETTTELTVKGTPTGAKIVAVDVGLDIDYSRMTDLTAKVLDCTATGTPIALSANPGHQYIAANTACAGTDLPVEWKSSVTDSVVGGTVGQIFNRFLTITYRGGDKDPPYPQHAVFTSSVRATPGAIGYGRVALEANLRGATALLEIRTAADEASLDAASWVAVADGEIPAVPRGEVMQYRITFATDGWQFATVERVAIAYIVPG